MKMNGKTLFIMLSLLWTLQMEAFSDADAKFLVNDFYQSLQKLSSVNIYIDHMDTNESFDLRERLLNMVVEGQDVMCVPNEASLFAGKEPSNKTYFNWYINSYHDYARDSLEKYELILQSFDIESCKVAVPPSGKKDVTSHNYYYVYVRKVIYGRFSGYDLLDLVCVDGSVGKIVGIGNKEFGGYSPKEYSDSNYNSLMAHAAWAYNKGYYDDAYDTYLKANFLEPKMDEPYYRMALMIYFRKGVKGRFKNKKERKEKMFKYLYEVNRRGADYYQDASNLLSIILWGGFV